MRLKSKPPDPIVHPVQNFEVLSMQILTTYILLNNHIFIKCETSNSHFYTPTSTKHFT